MGRRRGENRMGWWGRREGRGSASLPGYCLVAFFLKAQKERKKKQETEATSVRHLFSCSGGLRRARRETMRRAQTGHD